MNTEFVESHLSLNVAIVERGSSQESCFLVVTYTDSGRKIDEIILCDMSDPHMIAIAEAEAQQIADRINAKRKSSPVNIKIIHSAPPKIHGRYVNRKFTVYVGGKRLK